MTLEKHKNRSWGGRGRKFRPCHSDQTRIIRTLKVFNWSCFYRATVLQLFPSSPASAIAKDDSSPTLLGFESSSVILKASSDDMCCNELPYTIGELPGAHVLDTALFEILHGRLDLLLARFWIHVFQCLQYHFGYLLFFGNTNNTTSLRESPEFLPFFN